MQGLFPQFDTGAEIDYATAWNNALFVFDTNVLLNLYRYQSATRDELLNVLEKLAGRIWIPHHVALEFQRNRLKVIAEQSKRFTDVRRAIEKTRSTLLSEIEKLQLHRRHSLINPQPLTSGFDRLTEQFLSDLDRLQATQQKLTNPDPLKYKIETLFAGLVGNPPEDQKSVDDLYREAETRFKLQIPPGYKDAEKDKDAPDEHAHGGIIYKRKYGDYLVWRQLLSHAKISQNKSVVLITDDGKEDWWWKIESDGPKIVGPRPELIEEARLTGEIETFLMYNPEGFLKFAKEFLQAPVSEETLKEVRDISTTRSLRSVSFNEMQEIARRAEQAVFMWLEGRFESVLANHTGFPDFVAKRDEKAFGFEVKLVTNPKLVIHRVREMVYRAYYEINEARLSEVTIVWILGSPAEADEFKRLLSRTTFDRMPDALRMIIGTVAESESGEIGFVPIDEVAFSPSIRQVAAGAI